MILLPNGCRSLPLLRFVSPFLYFSSLFRSAFPQRSTARPRPPLGCTPDLGYPPTTPCHEPSVLSYHLLPASSHRSCELFGSRFTSPLPSSASLPRFLPNTYSSSAFLPNSSAPRASQILSPLRFPQSSHRLFLAELFGSRFTSPLLAENFGSRLTSPILAEHFGSRLLLRFLPNSSAHGSLPRFLPNTSAHGYFSASCRTLRLTVHFPDSCRKLRLTVYFPDSCRTLRLTVHFPDSCRTLRLTVTSPLLAELFGSRFTAPILAEYFGSRLLLRFLPNSSAHGSLPRLLPTTSAHGFRYPRSLNVPVCPALAPSTVFPPASLLRYASPDCPTVGAVTPYPNNLRYNMKLKIESFHCSLLSLSGRLIGYVSVGDAGDPRSKLVCVNSIQSKSY
ncbi:hypothetical protein OUZ56_029642 [Daphnia magna]|uniref:Uncharacterized protein n=1 Tax=Daphnia magna TaxID=35525 RepID=A0ABR0B7F5_9CRUS|nr:hypothetical protein OUZ56_029642 [Daphnia magna]